MKNYFAYAVIALFCAAGAVALVNKQYAVGLFYIFSAALNVTVLYMGAI